MYFVLIYLSLGGNVTGKASCEFMCFSGSSFTNSSGPTLNPHDPTRSTGGSSGGSAVLVCIPIMCFSLIYTINTGNLIFMLHDF